MLIATKPQLATRLSLAISPPLVLPRQIVKKMVPATSVQQMLSAVRLMVVRWLDKRFAIYPQDSA